MAKDVKGFELVTGDIVNVLCVVTGISMGDNADLSMNTVRPIVPGALATSYVALKSSQVEFVRRPALTEKASLCSQ